MPDVDGGGDYLVRVEPDLVRNGTPYTFTSDVPADARDVRRVKIYVADAWPPAVERSVIEASRRPRAAPVVASTGSRIADIETGTAKTGPWWGWSDAKYAMEWLFFAGEVTTATRRGAFERVYDLSERVLPADVLALPTPEPAEAQRALLRIASRALGVATARDLRDYFRLPTDDFRARLVELVEAGDLLPVEVEDWQKPGYLDPAARQPRRIETRALLAPFDPLIWERDRTERLFDFHYRIEIYTPVAKRKHGYYVLPFLLNDKLVARVDLKADRANSRLLAHAVHLEPGNDAAKVAGPLRDELRLMADWLGLESVALPRAGALAKAMSGTARRR